MADVPAADLLPVQRQATWAYRAVRVVGIPLLHLLFRIEVEGAENTRLCGPYVVIANHLNWLDSFLLLSTFPAEPRVHFLGDPTILVTRKLQWFIVRQVGGFIPVNRKLRGDPRLFEHVNRCLQAGGAVGLYPEGNYGEAEGSLLPFKKGFAHFAIDNAVPVIPVGLCGCKDLWLRKKVRVSVGRPISSQGRSVDSLVADGQEQVSQLIPAYSEPAGPKLLRRFLTHLF